MDALSVLTRLCVWFAKPSTSYQLYPMEYANYAPQTVTPVIHQTLPSASIVFLDSSYKTLYVLISLENTA